MSCFFQIFFQHFFFCCFFSNIFFMNLNFSDVLFFCVCHFYFFFFSFSLYFYGKFHPSYFFYIFSSLSSSIVSHFQSVPINIFNGFLILFRHSMLILSIILIHCIFPRSTSLLVFLTVHRPSLSLSQGFQPSISLFI